MSLCLFWSFATKFFPILQKPTSQPKPIRFVANQPKAPMGQTKSLKKIMPIMEQLEGRSTPALYFGADLLAIPDMVTPRDWLAQPLKGVVNTTPDCAIFTEHTQKSWEAPAHIRYNPVPFMGPFQSKETNREASMDVLFQQEDWTMGSFAPSWSLFPENHNPDSLLLAGLAVIGIPFLNACQNSKVEEEITLPQKRSLKKQKKQWAK